jgi:hypothetical protein
MLRALLAIGLWTGTVQSFVLTEDTLQYDATEAQQSLPIVKLPYGSYRAKAYVRSHDASLSIKAISCTNMIYRFTSLKISDLQHRP